MHRGGEIAGRVVDEAGTAVEGAGVQAERAATEPQSAFYFATAEPGDGRFVIRDIAAGTYSLQARAEGRAEAARSNLSVLAGRTLDVGTLVLSGGGLVVGTVVDAEGRGIPGATVAAERDGNRRMNQHQTQSGSSGGFEIRGLAAGPVDITARHPAYSESRPVVAEVDPEKEPQPVRLVLTRGGRIEGRAIHRDGRPFSGGRVSFYSMEPEARACASRRLASPQTARSSWTTCHRAGRCSR